MNAYDPNPPSGEPTAADDGIGNHNIHVPQITLITKRGSSALMSKRIFLDGDGKLKSDGSECRMTSGEAIREFAGTATALAQIIASCGSEQAIALGTLKAEFPGSVAVTIPERLKEHPGAITRARHYIDYQPGVSAWCLIDFDTKGMPKEVSDRIDAEGGMWAALLKVVPELANAARVSRSSTSAGLFRSDTGEPIAGSNGMHHYVLVQDGGDVERFLKDLHDRCWAHGLGWHMIGGGGQLLDRSVIDRMVGFGERLCFEGAPVVVAPVAQDQAKRKPEAIEGKAINSAGAVPRLNEYERHAVREAKAVSAKALGKSAAAVRKKHDKELADKISAKTGASLATALRLVKARHQGTLYPDIELETDRLGIITVGAVLADPDRYVGETLADPMEGVDYGRGKAKVMKGDDDTLLIHSFAHGRGLYFLRYDLQSAKAAIAPGSGTVDQAMTILAHAELEEDEVEEFAGFVAKAGGVSVRAVKARIKKEREERTRKGRTERALDWREQRKDGAPVPSMHNARLAIVALGIECRYDLFHNKLLFGPKDDTVRHAVEQLVGEVTDNGVIALRQRLSDTFGFDLTDKHVRDGIKSLALEHCFDPVVDMLAAAEAGWDGIERLDRMAVDYFNCEDNKLNRAFVRKAMLAGVARPRTPGIKFDQIIVLESPEGFNKSTALRVLAGDENFSDESIIGKNSREVQEQLSEIWIHENADLAGMKRAEVETVKAYASRMIDIARPAYDHFSKKQKRHSIEVGTTNSDRYLQSQTGNRRFWPLRILKSIDIEKLRRDRLQLWGEAAHYESQGESLVLDEALWGDAGIEQEKRRIGDPWEDILGNMKEMTTYRFYQDGVWHEGLKVIVHHVNNEERVSSEELLTVLLNIAPGNLRTDHTMRLAAVMKRLGWQRLDNGYVTIHGKRMKGYFRPKQAAS